MTVNGWTPTTVDTPSYGWKRQAISRTRVLGYWSNGRISACHAEGADSISAYPLKEDMFFRNLPKKIEKCKKHRRYDAKFPPHVGCETCWKNYIDVRFGLDKHLNKKSVSRPRFRNTLPFLCKRHRAYMAKQKPRVTCVGCWFIYIIEHHGSWYRD